MPAEHEMVALFPMRLRGVDAQGLFVERGVMSTMEKALECARPFPFVTRSTMRRRRSLLITLASLARVSPPLACSCFGVAQSGRAETTAGANVMTRNCRTRPADRRLREGRAGDEGRVFPIQEGRRLPISSGCRSAGWPCAQRRSITSFRSFAPLSPVAPFGRDGAGRTEENNDIVLADEITLRV